MNRREYLALNSGLLLTGCTSLGTPTGPDSEPSASSTPYEKCNNTFVRIESLPTPAKEEAMTAITEEVYETDGELILPEVIDIDTAYLHGGGTMYYKMTVTSGDGLIRLRAERVQPKRTGLPTLVNRMETDVTVDIHVTSWNELMFEDTITLASGTEANLDDGTAYRYGGYQATLTISTGKETREEEVGWRVNHIHGLGKIVISGDDVRMTDGPSKERADCEWNDEGELMGWWRAIAPLH